MQCEETGFHFLSAALFEEAVYAVAHRFYVTQVVHTGVFSKVKTRVMLECVLSDDSICHFAVGLFLI